MRVRSLLVPAVLAVLLFLVSLPLLRPEFFFTHDYVHGARIGEVLRSWQAGHLPVRWSQYFGFGYGMPLFEFYAPLPYYVGALFYGLGLPLVTAVKVVFFAASVLAITGAYLCAKVLAGRRAGLVAAVLFGLAPYRAVNLYVRGAVSESWAMAFFPWITLGIVLVIKRQRWGWLILTISLLGLLLSHNLSTLIFVPLSLAFGLGYLVISGMSKKWQVWSQLALAYAASVGLAAFYIFPAYLEKNLTQIGLILSGYFDFRLHFVYLRQLVTPYWGYGGSTWGVEDGLSFFLGTATLLGLLICVFSMAYLLWQKKRAAFQQLWPILLLLSLAGVSLLMSIGRSQSIWEQIALLSYIQFPWRWLAPAAWWLAIAVGMGATLLPRRLSWLGIATVLLVAGTQVQYFKPERYLETANSFYYATPDRIAEDMSSVLMDYVPAGFDYKWAENNPLFAGQLLISPQLDSSLILDLPHHRQLQVALERPETLELGVAAFPGWVARIDDRPVTASVSAKGLITVPVPSGEHVVELRFVSTPVRQISDVISLVSLVVTAAVVGYVSYSSRKLPAKKVQPIDAKNNRSRDVR